MKVIMLRVGSLFCGAGGFDLGFKLAGHQILWAFDNDKDCIQTYRHNFGEHGRMLDVAEANFYDFADVDLIIGGFPCQGFSQANKHRNGDDNRNQLYLQFVRAIKEKQPKYFLAENVRGILSLEKGEAMKRIIQDFSDAGYDVEYQVFNASHFGVPQNRIRVFIWGIRKDISAERNWPVATTAEKPVTVGEALKDIPDPEEAPEILNHIGSKYKVTNRNFTGCRTTDPNKPCPTIIARGNGKGGVNAIQHPKNHRRMTVRESAIVQSFPMDFEFFGSMSSCYRQVGNAVPVKLAQAFGESFKKVGSL
ncbi:DNA cytosine methyltransferase [Vibrio breoganii]|uniref:DNA cytosine methyltransferase n=2 Tax=Vibrio TaxID=662 RepID=UPI001F0EC395|nr:DNA cytosine methyltransferase [Vibrio breoganii]